MKRSGPQSQDQLTDSRTLEVHIGHHELVIRHRYEVLSICNDILVGVWFLVGSFFFLSTALTTLGTWLFIVGSLEMLIRPVIRLARRVHLQKFHSPSAAASDTSFDY